MSVWAPSAFGPGEQNRALVPCVLASLALHALVLLLPGLRAGAPAGAAAHVLTAKFAPHETAPAPPTPPTSTTHEGKAEPELLRSGSDARREAPSSAASTPSVAPAPAAEIPAGTAPATDPPAAVPAGAAAGPASRARTSVAASPGAGRTGIDAGTLDQYRLALIGFARRYKRYPAQAVDQGWQGRVEIHLVVGASGAIASTLVKASSGYEILDNQAMEMVKQAMPLAPIPAALRGREFSVDIPVIFDLQAG
jgi:periplasmic protein TonB